MISRVMESKEEARAGFDNSSFSAVLQEIYQQTQKEIDARNRNLSSQYPAVRRLSSEEIQRPSHDQVQPKPSSFDEIRQAPYEELQQSSFETIILPSYDEIQGTTYNEIQPSSSTAFYDVTGRFEPLMDPALSFISGILAEDDEPAINHPFVNIGEFVAYQAKASEMAALLKEDSPALALKIEGDSPVSPDEGSFSSISDDSCYDSLSNVHLTYLDMETASSSSLLSVSTISEPSRNELLLTSLRGPVNKPTSSSTSPTETFINGQVKGQEGRGGLVHGRGLGHSQDSKTARVGSQDDIGVRSHGHKAQKSEKTGRILKPRKESSKRGSGGKSRIIKDGDQECVELNDLLLQCAYAVGVNNTKRAIEILKKVRQYATPYGSGSERLAYYFAEAMEARFSGTGWPLYLGLLERRPSAAEILKSIYMYMEHCPFVKAYHYFINHTILNVAKGASKLHILELQIDGFQYPALFKALADRPGGPPEVHIIGLGFPHYSMLPARTDIVLEAVQKIGRLLEAYAAKCGVPFQYTAWAGVREDLRMQDFVSPYRKEGEVLVVISASLLRYVMDDTLDSPVVRSKLLKQGRDINPEVYIQGIVTGSYSTPFFTRRFKEALFHFESVFDMLDNFIEKEKTDRIVFESEILGKAILNIVACEGAEVVDRVDKYKHWQLVTEEVGFQQLPLDEEIKSNTQHMLESWHKEYTVSQDSQYLLMGWKGRMLHAMSTWKASPEESSLG